MALQRNEPSFSYRFAEEKIRVEVMGLYFASAVKASLCWKRTY